MIHITKTKRWLSLEDQIAYEQYQRLTQGLRAVYISPKELKIKQLSALTGKPKSYWSKLKSKQLGKILSDKKMYLTDEQFEKSLKCFRKQIEAIKKLSQEIYEEELSMPRLPENPPEERRIHGVWQ